MTPALQRPVPSSPPSNAPLYTGIWMGWRWLDGKPTEPAPAVSR
jgi:hypothetical protein